MYQKIKSLNKNLIKSLIIFGVLITMNKSYSQASGLCGCDGQTITRTYSNLQGSTFTITFIDCPPSLLIVNVEYTGPAGPFILQEAMDMLLNDQSLNFQTVYFQGECAAMASSSGGGWGEGSGPRGTVTYNLKYCTSASTCCPMSRTELSGAFVGLRPACGSINVNGSWSQCFTICHPNE